MYDYKQALFGSMLSSVWNTESLTKGFLVFLVGGLRGEIPL